MHRLIAWRVPVSQAGSTAGKPLQYFPTAPYLGAAGGSRAKAYPRARTIILERTPGAASAARAPKSERGLPVLPADPFTTGI
jgi:hypothetical protein